MHGSYSTVAETGPFAIKSFGENVRRGIAKRKNMNMQCFAVKFCETWQSNDEEKNEI